MREERDQRVGEIRQALEARNVLRRQLPAGDDGALALVHGLGDG